MSHETPTQIDGQNTQSRVSEFTNDTAREFVVGALKEEFRDASAKAKHIARAANTNHRTVENWLAGRCCPSLPAFLHLLQTVPNLRARVRELCEMETAFDPDFERLKQQTERLLVEYSEALMKRGKA